MIARALVVSGMSVLLAAAACSAPAGVEPDVTSGDDAKSDAAKASAIPRGALRGVQAERLINSLEPFKAVTHASASSASVDVSEVRCLTAWNGFIEEIDPAFMIPQTTCTLKVARATRELEDPLAAGAALFTALEEAGADTDAATGKEFAEVSRISCRGIGLGAGADPGDGDFEASCTLELADATTKSVDGTLAWRLINALDLMDAADHAMGGRVGADATDVVCRKSRNEFLDEGDALFGVPTYGCRMKSDIAGDLDQTDAAPQSVALFDALVAAGLEESSATGKSGVSATRLRCRRTRGQPTWCAITK